MEHFIPFMLIGAVVTAGLFIVISWLRKHNIKASWYEWLIGILGLGLLLLAVQHLLGAMSELFFYAAWMGFAIIGIPALILLVVAWQLVARRVKQS
ncbi:dehalogenase [Dehalococcoides mccartyi]|uniref:dehalogenase n=1 Tax=Dehalococcoides mccartyi TaxID=61435 RepID=UPI001A060935|nr:dehalogenase [Dehalococcoides mccartyi]MBF4481749.1 dehalogenase [Dehalococcoides mccartyi]MBJ7531507.1 dehalogenase [Dehalococcoides mccartyi]